MTPPAVKTAMHGTSVTGQTQSQSFMANQMKNLGVQLFLKRTNDDGDIYLDPVEPSTITDLVNMADAYPLEELNIEGFRAFDGESIRTAQVHRVGPVRRSDQAISYGIFVQPNAPDDPSGVTPETITDQYDPIFVTKEPVH